LHVASGGQQASTRARLATELLVVRVVAVGPFDDQIAISEKPVVCTVRINVQAYKRETNSKIITYNYLT